MQQPKKGLNSNLKSGTDAQKVKQEIQKDISEGQGDITAREAGGMRDKK
ncbi:hypothetical protein [Amphibacillus sediminis]|nr:hypothetical protein [Amphibacillus sediminis]